MKNYITLRQYAKYMEMLPGDVVFISSDATLLLYDAMKNKADADLNQMIDGLIEVVGTEGTVIFPTYNWSFCSGRTFDYNKTPCETGLLGTTALKRDDFKRTKHPIYSFAVYGKYQDYLCNMDNIDSFGTDSPFAFFREKRAKNYIFDVVLEHSFTFAHYAEQQSGVVDYRYIKNFTAGYIDSERRQAEKTYSMFVRDLDRDVETLIDPIEPDFLQAGAEKNFYINSSQIKLIYMDKAYDIMLADIVHNRSRKLCRFKGQ